jgi:hypothetical protein
MLKHAYKRVNDWENQQLLTNKRQRISYGVNVAEQLNPKYLKQTEGPRKRTNIPPLQKHKIEEYFPHMSPPTHIQQTQQTSDNQTTAQEPNTDPPKKNKTQDAQELQEEILKFYENLYKNENPDPQAMAQVMKLLSEKQVASWKVCEGKITEEELAIVVKKCNLNKSPGTDGIPYEYYKQHLSEASPFLVENYNDILENETLGPTMLERIITLMYKEKGANTHIKNYRPITLAT